MTPLPNSLCNYLKLSNPCLVKIKPDKDSVYNNCHNNAIFSPHKEIIGYYFLQKDDILYAIKHSVIEMNGELVDISPHLFKDNFIYFSKTLREDYYDSLVLYVEDSILINRDMNIQNKKYYIYALVDPRTHQPFYIGKGCNNRWQAHLKETKESTENWHKFCIIQDIQNNGLSVVVDFLVNNIDDETLAYDIEKSYIKKYGRISEGGILTNVCEDNMPPSLRNKTYEEIYGAKANYQREKRYKMQIDAGGWFKGHKHTQESKNKISIQSSGISNGNSCKLTENDILELLKEFSILFDNKISLGRWEYFCKLKNITPNIRKSFRFDKKDIFEVAREKYGTKILKCDKLLWFYDKNNPENKKRILEWKYNISPSDIPPNYIRGRGNIK